MRIKSVFFTLFVFVFGLCGTLGYFEFQGSVSHAQSTSASVWDGEVPENVNESDWLNDSNRFYFIRSAKGFAYFASLVNAKSGYKSFLGATVYLETDIDLNNQPFGPIGNGTNVFQGTFDGQGHYIYNLKFANSTSAYVGLFGKLTDRSTIKNLHIRNLDVTVSSQTSEIYVGGMVGHFENTANSDINYNLSSLIECSVKGKININNLLTQNTKVSVGGIAGAVQGASVSNCMAAVDIITTDSNISIAKMGGICGAAIGTKVESCFNEGSLKISNDVSNSDNYIGGLCGYVDGHKKDTKIRATTLSNTYNVGYIDVSNEDQNNFRVGGLVGIVDSKATSFSLKSSYNAGSVGASFVDNTSASLGGLVGNISTSTAKLENSFMVGELKSETKVGTKVGTISYLYNGSNVSATNLYFHNYDNGTENGAVGNLKALAKTAEFYSNDRYWKNGTAWDKKVWRVKQGLNNGYAYLIYAFNNGNANNDSDQSNGTTLKGDGSQENPYLIETAGDLGYLSFNYIADKHYSLKNNIDLSGKTWQPIGNSEKPFAGVFNGNGFTISGITCSLQEQFGYHGLFGVTANAVIKNLVVENFRFINGETGESGTNGNTNDNICGSFVGLVQRGTTYIINCVDRSGISGLLTIGHIGSSTTKTIVDADGDPKTETTTGASAFAVYGKNNLNFDGILQENTLKLGEIDGWEKGYDITVSGRGGNFLRADTSMYLGEYHILIEEKIEENGEKSFKVLDVSSLDKSYGETYLPTLSGGNENDQASKTTATTPEYGYGKTDVLIRRGYKLKGYKYEKGGDVDIANLTSPERQIYGIYADWGTETNNENVTVTVIYNAYEQANFGAENKVSVDYSLEYDSFLGDYPELFEAPNNMRSGKFKISALYSSFGNGGFEDEHKLKTTTLINKDLTVYAEWEGLEAAGFQFIIDFEKAGGFEGDFDLADALNSITKKEFKNGGYKDDPTIKLKDKTSVSFDYNTTLSDKTNNWFEFELLLNQGYGFSGAPILENKNDTNFGGIYVEGANTPSENKINKSFNNLETFNNSKFLNLVGDYKMTITLRRVECSNKVNLGEGVVFGLSPKIMDYENVSLLNKNENSFQNLNSIFPNYTGNTSYLGYDAFNNKIVSAKGEYDAVTLDEKYIIQESGDNSSSKFVLFQYELIDEEGNETVRYFVYKIYQEADADDKDTLTVVKLYELVNENGAYKYSDDLIKIKKSNDQSAMQAEMFYLANSSFGFIFSTEMDDLVFSNYGVSGNLYGASGKIIESEREKVAKTSELVSVSMAGEGGTTVVKHTKFLIEINNLYGIGIDGDGAVDANTTFTKALFKFNAVYRGESEREKKLFEANKPVVRGNNAVYDVSGDGSVYFEVESNDYFEFASARDAGAPVLWNNLNYNIQITVSNVNQTNSSAQSDNASSGEETWEGGFNSNNNGGFSKVSLGYTAKGTVIDPVSKKTAEKDFFKVTLSYKQGLLMPGLYNVEVICQDVLYSINYASKFMTFDNLQSGFDEKKLTDEDDSGVKVGVAVNPVGNNDNYNYDSKVLNEIKFADTISANTYLGDNKGYGFYGWYAKGEGYSGIVGQEKRLRDFVFKDRYRSSSLTGGNLSPRYNLTLYAVYIQKKVQINISSQVLLLSDSNGSESGKKISQNELGLWIGMNEKTSISYDYSVSSKEKTELDNIKFTKSSTNANGYYFCGYTLVDKDGNPVGDGIDYCVYDPTTGFSLLDDITKILTGGDEIGNISGLFNTYYLMPKIKAKTATIYFHSGAGTSGYGDGKAGDVYSSEKLTTTETVVRKEGVLFGATLLLNQNLEVFVGEAQETSSVNIDNMFATRTGHYLLPNGYWKNWNPGGNGRSLDWSQLILNSQYFDAGENMNIDLHFVKVWKQATYNLSFRANGGQFGYADYYNVSVTYDEEVKTSNLPSTNNLSRTGYDFDGWALNENEDGESRIFDKEMNLVPENGTNEIFKDKKYNVDGNSQVFAVWIAKTYTVEIKYNSANSVNGSQINSAEDESVKYSIKYDSTFAELFIVENNPKTKIEDILPERLGYKFKGIFAASENRRVKIENSTKFDNNLLSVNLNADPALVLYVDWSLDYGYLSLKLNDKSLPNLTYNAGQQTVNVADYFVGPNIVASGFLVSNDGGDLKISLHEAMSSEVALEISSTTATIDDPSKMRFNVENAGVYYVELSVKVVDKAAFLNQGTVLTLNFSLRISVDQAEVSYSVGDNVRLQNVKKIMKNLTDKETNDKLDGCSSFEQFVAVIKQSDETATNASNLEIYNFVMFKYFKLSRLNNFEYNTFKGWKFADFQEYVTNHEEEVSSALKYLVFFDFYDMKNTSSIHRLQGYEKVEVVSSQVSDLSSEISVDRLIFYHGLDSQLLPNSLYSVRIYLRNATGMEKLANYKIYYDNDGAGYIYADSGYLLPQILVVENLEQTKSVYYSSSYNRREVSWAGNRVSLEFNAKTYYHIGDNVFLSATLYTSNAGQATSDTLFSYKKDDNYLFFNDVSIILQNGNSFEDISTRFKLVLNEDDIFTVLNTNGVANIVLSANYLTKISGVLSFDRVADKLASELLKITTVNYTINGVEKSSYDSEGLASGVFEEDGSVVYEIIQNNSNQVSLFINNMVSSVGFITTSINLTENIALYKWADYPYYAIDGTMEKQGSFTINKSDIDFENRRDEYRFYAVYTDLVLINYNLNVPENFPISSSTTTVLKLGESTINELSTPNETGLNLASMKIKRPSGETLDYTALFSGQDFGNGQVFEGLDISNRHAPVTIDVKWEVADFDYEQNFETMKTAVQTLEQITVENVVYIMGQNETLYKYDYKWYFKGVLVGTGKTLVLKEKGSVNESGDYSLVVTATLTPALISSLENPSQTQKTLTIDFSLEFIKHKVDKITLPSFEELEQTYDNRDHIRDWFVSVDYFVYDNENNNYSDEPTTRELSYVTTGSIYFKVFNNSVEVSSMKNAGVYRILICFDEALFDLGASIAESDKEFLFTIKPFSVDLSTYDFSATKSFNSVEPSLNQEIYLQSENVSLSLSRALGEDVGNYDLYFKDINQDFKNNYTFTFGNVVLFENGVLTESGKTTSVGNFEIVATKTLRISYQISQSLPKNLFVDYSSVGYTLKLTDDMKLQILNGDFVVYEMSLLMYDVATGSNITNAEILNIIKNKLSDLTPKFYDVSPREVAVDSMTYTYCFEMGTQIAKYFSNVEFDNSFNLTIGKIVVDVSEFNFDKIYDGKNIVYMDTTGAILNDIDSFSGIYISGIYENTHVGNNIKVELAYLSKGTSENISNYELSAYSALANISKLRATMTINLAKSQYNYGEVSINNLQSLVSSLSVVDDAGQSKEDLLVSGFYEIAYSLEKSVSTNERGFVYKGSYNLEARATFQDFEMTLNLPSFEILPMMYQKVLLPNSITTSVLTPINASYLDSVTVVETGDVLNLEYFPEGLTAGAKPVAGVYNLILLNETFANDSIIVSINENNRAFEVLTATNILYVRLDNESIFKHTYAGKDFTLTADAVQKKIVVTSENKTFESTLSFFTKDNDGNESSVAVDSFSLSELSVFSGENTVSFKRAGIYRLILKAVSMEYANIMFENEKYFEVSKLSIDVSQFAVEKDYDGDATVVLESFNEKVVGDVVSILARFENSDAGEGKNVSLYLNGVDTDNYKLSASSKSGNINRAEAMVELTKSSVSFGEITKLNEISFVVKSKGQQLLSSQYSVVLEVENPSYSTLNFLEVGTYSVVLKNWVSSNYNIALSPSMLTITPYQLSINLTTSGGFRTEFGSADALSDTFVYSYLSPLYEQIDLNLTRQSGNGVGDYKVLSGVSANRNYVVKTLEDTSATGFFRIIPASEKMYLLLSNEETLDSSSSGTEVFVEYDGNLYDSVSVQERGVGLYRLVMENSSNQTISLSFDLNFYTYNSSTDTYTKSNAIVEGLTTEIKFLNPTMVRNIGSYEMYASLTESTNFEVRIGKANEQFCFTLNILKRQLYFKNEVLSKVFDNKNAEFVYENASEMLENMVENENLVLNVKFVKNGEIAKFAGINYDVVANVLGDTFDNYNLNLSTKSGTKITAVITRADMTFVVNDQTFVYGQEIVLDYDYQTEIDLNEYDTSRLSFSLEVDAKDNYSTSGALRVGEYNMLLYFVSQDFNIAGYLVNNNSQQNLTAKLNITPKKLELTQKVVPLQDIFTKNFDGTNTVKIFDEQNNLLFGLSGLNVSDIGDIDSVSVEEANYASEYIGQDIKVDFVLGGEDKSNYVLDAWIYGIIKPVLVNIKFDYKADGSDVVSNVEANGLQLVSLLNFPFMSTSYLTANSALTNSNSTRNFPSTLTGKTGYSFTYWTMDFDGVSNGSAKLSLLTNIVSSLGLESFYNNDIFSVRVDNSEKTVRFLDALINDSSDLFGLYYKTNNNIQVTFNANWNINKYRVTLMIADVEGKSSEFGKVEIDDENPDSENIVVTDNYLGEFSYDSVLTLRATANDHCNFYGFYTGDGKLLEGTEPFISIGKEGDVNTLRVSNIRQNYNFVVRYMVQKVDVVLDFADLQDVSIESEDFVGIGNGKFRWSTDFVKVDQMSIADLPEILRVGYVVTSMSTDSATISKDNFASTKLSSLLPVSSEQLLTLTLRPTFEAVGVVVTLDFGYDEKTQDISVPFGQAYEKSSGWIETPQRTGWKFVGWFDSQNTRVFGHTVLSSVDSHKLTAHWEINKYSIEFVSPNSVISDASIEFVLIGESYIANEIVFGSTFTFKVSAKTGYQISNSWQHVDSVEINNGIATVTMTMPAENLKYELPVVPLQNEILILGERLGSILAYDVTDSEKEINVENNRLNLQTGRKLKLVVSAVSGYYVTENIRFDDGFGLVITKRTENNSLVVEIEGIQKDLTLAFETAESRNNITLSFETIGHVELVEVDGITYNDVSNLPRFEANTDSVLELYVKFVYGYNLGNCSSNEFSVSSELITSGIYIGYYRIEISDISSDGTVLIGSVVAKFTLTMGVISYDENKNKVEVAGNQAFVNGEVSIEVEFNTSVTLSTIHANLYSFAGWTKDGNDSFSTENPVGYTVTRDETIYAIFSSLKFNISFATYNYFTVYNEYGDPSKVETKLNEISGGRYFEGETDREISGMELYYGANKTIRYQLPRGYLYYGVGFRNSNGEFVYLSVDEKIEQTVSVNISSLLLDETQTDIKLYTVVKAYSATLNIESKIDIDGERETDIGVGHLNIQASNGAPVNRYGYIDGTRVHYSAKDFENGVLLDNKKFGVVGYTGDVVYLKVQTMKAGYKFLSVVANRQDVDITKLVENESFILFEISNIIGGLGDIDIEVLFKPVINIVDLAFVYNDIKVDGGVFSFKISEQNKRKVWTSGREYSSVVVSAYTDSSFEVVALIRAGFNIDQYDLQINDPSGLIEEGSFDFQRLSIVDTGYTAKLTFKVSNYLGLNSITIGVKPSKYTVNLKEETETLVSIKNVSFNQALNLTQYNEENISIFDGRIQFVNGKLKLDLKQANYNFEGFFTYQNGAGVQYINSSGEAVNAWRESGYILNSTTSKYQLAENAVLNPETGELEISLYLYWSYLKTRISFEFVPGISTNYTAQDMVNGVDYSNSWFYETAPLYIEVSFNTDIHITAPEIDGYKFYKFVIRQKNAEGTWLSDVTSFSSDVPWSTNEYDRIVECNVQVVYFAQIEVTTFGGDATYKISQEASDTQARLLLQEGFVDTSKEFVVEAIEGEGFMFLRWVNTSSGQSFFTKDITLSVNKKTNLVMNLQGHAVTLNFEDYDPTFGQISNLKVSSLDNSYQSYRLGGFSGDEFIKTLYEVDVKVGDKLTFVLSIDFGFGVDWNRNDITFVEYTGGMYYFEMSVSSNDANSKINIIPNFRDEVVSVYISSAFVTDDIKSNAVDSNNVSLAGHTLFNGKKTSFFTNAKNEDIRIVTVTNSRYEISKIVIKNYDKTFEDMSDFFTEEGVINLSNEYMQANNIVGNIQILIEYTRLMWEDMLLQTNSFEGEGSTRNPYQIKNVDELILFMNLVNSGAFNRQGIRYRDCSFKLMADIDLNDRFWTPIGTKESAFNGRFNFNGFKISNIYTAYFYDVVSWNGLFGVLGFNAEIIQNQVSYWYVYLIVAIVSLLVILLVVLLLLNRRRRKIREELAKK